MKRRCLALEKIGWDQQKKQTIAAVLIPAYTSSDEEEDSARPLFTDAGHCPYRFISKLSWESQELSANKQDLDRFYMNNIATAQHRRMMVKRVRGHAVSTRMPPTSDAQQWAVANHSDMLAN